jgi:hypothetical protein
MRLPHLGFSPVELHQLPQADEKSKAVEEAHPVQVVA